MANGGNAKEPAPSDQERPMVRSSTPLKLVLLYLLFGCLWILLSDKLLEATVSGERLLTRIQSFKGLLYVGLSGLLIYFLAEVYLRRTRAFENALLMSARDYRLLMEQASDAIYIADRQGRLLQVNDRMCELTGYSRDELVKKSLDEFIPDEDLSMDPLELNRILAGETVLRERRIVRRDGTILVVEVGAKMMQDGRIQGIARDVTERNKAQELLTRQARELDERIKEMKCLYAVATRLHRRSGASEDALRSVVAIMPSGWQWNEVAAARLILDGQEYATENFRETRWKLVHDIIVKGQHRGTLEVRYLAERPLQDEGPFLKEERELLGVLAGHIAEFVDAQETERELEDLYEKLEALFRASPLAIVALDTEARVTMWNPTAERVFGWRKDEVLGREHPLLPEEEREAFRIRYREKLLFESGQYDAKRLTKDGRILDISVSYAPLKDAHGVIVGTVAMLADISERKRTEERLRLLSTALEAAANAVVIADRSQRITWVNHAFTELTGYELEEVVGRPMPTLWSSEHDDAFYERIHAAIEAGQVWRGELRSRRKDGSWYEEEQTITPVCDDQDQVVAFIAIVQDISARRLAEQSLAESERRYRLIVQNSSDVVSSVDANFTIVYISPSCERVLGYKPEALVGTNALQLVHPDDVAPVMDAFRLARLDGTARAVISYRYRHADGRWLTLESTGSHEAGQAMDYHVINTRDVSDRKQLEEQLRQSQKMEAIGQLAGGVAHDFNNLLMTIAGYTELVLQDTPPHDPRREDLDEIMKATERAASLVRHLLTFSRRKATQTELLDLNAVISDLLKLLGRALGQDVQLTTRLAPDLAPVRADLTHLEQVLMNLAVNARDAMCGRGTLVIETRNVTIDGTYGESVQHLAAGNYVLLSVSDTGAGMTEEVKSRIFEPFFTTKPEGQGTGLGLATVYGIVEEHGGKIRVYSEPNQGTSFHIYLPSTAMGDGSVAVDFEGDAGAISGSECVMVVDDEESLCRLISDTLESYGYRVLSAGSVEEALALFGDHGDGVALLVSDVVMPGGSGPELYKAFLEKRPDLRALFISGYARGFAENQNGSLDAPLLQKPFSLIRLVRMVREILDG